MSKIKDFFSFDNPKFSPIKKASRDVIEAYQNGNRYLDTAQEYVYIKLGMPNLAKVIHNQAHEFPKTFDRFVDMLHERHLMAEYPATEELDTSEYFNNLDSVFSFVITVFEDIGEKLEVFRNITDNGELRPMSLFAEELIAENSKNYTKFLEMWARWDINENVSTSLTTFDSWCSEHFKE